jgi:outer membrane receptor protein involved in Fe transport
MKPHQLKIAAACSLAIAARYGASAQSSTNTSTMEKTVIEGIPLEETVVPTARPFNSVYGADMSILDTPRNVTIISREQLDAISIQDPRDFMKLTSSSYTDSNFGAPTTPSIRGQYADTFVNGSRVGLTSNGNGLPIDFNAIESVNIVKGPASVVYGPSQYVGGYVDYVTKHPLFDGFHGQAYGEFGMYDQYRWGLDVGGPVGESKKSGYRISYSGEDSGSYFTDGYKHTQALYAAYELNPSDNYNVFINNEIFYAKYTENFGINRPTQALIDSGLYQTGVNGNGGTGPTPGDPQNAINATGGFPPNHIVLGPVVQISRRSRLLAPGDHSEGVSDNFQVIQTVRLTDDSQIVNSSFFRYVRRATESSYYYSEVIDPSWSFDNRTEYRLTLDHHSINAGLDVRYQSVRAYNDFYSEPANVWDLTQSHSDINLLRSVNFGTGWPNYLLPGTSWDPRFRFTPDNGDSGVSTDLQAGPFVQEVWKVTDKLSILGGGRLDIIEAAYHVDSPAGHLGDNTLFALPNANGSVNYRWTPEYSSYFTYNYSQNPVGATGNGGGVTTGGNNTFADSTLRNASILYEVGSKASLFGNRLFLNLALFDQERADRQQDLTTTTFRTKGVEAEVNYQPDRNFYVTLSYTWMDAEVNKPQFFVNNTDIPGYVSYGAYLGSVGPGPYRRQGLPQNQFNLLATYKFDCGLGFSAGIVATSEINNDVAGTLRIPNQYSLDLGAFYTWNRFTARVNVLNATDQKNWSAPNYVYGQESIVADLPIRVEGRLTVRF